MLNRNGHCADEVRCPWCFTPLDDTYRYDTQYGMAKGILMVMAEKLTIDELARAAGTTSRNVRAHQSRGLLPPPEIRGRIGYYDQDHVTRLKLIAHLQQRAREDQAPVWGVLPDRGSNMGRSAHLRCDPGVRRVRGAALA